MSDDEDIMYVKRQKLVHYGSLEEGGSMLRMQMAASGEGGGAGGKGNLAEGMSDEAIRAALESGNINISDEYMDMEEELSKDRQALLEEFERRKRARQINVSTDDEEVKRHLRQLGQPVCLFGEGPADRRNRLRDLLSRCGEEGQQPQQQQRTAVHIATDRPRPQPPGRKEQEGPWYHEGPDTLFVARRWLADYSLPRARDRLEDARSEKGLPEAVRTARRQELQKQVQSMAIACSQVGDIRPVSSIQFSPNSTMLATASWSGLCKLWSIPDCSLKRTYRGHGCNVGAVVFHPRATIDLDDSACCLASCASDGSVRLWNLISDEPVADIQGHAPYRVSGLAYHPSGRFLATCCFDNSWRLWDLEQLDEVLHQEGHSRPVYCCAFQTDGSLIATGGLDSFARVWDLRTGRCIMFMDGHLKSVLSIDFSTNGYQVATGSEDHAAKIWDVRKRGLIYTIPAHNNLVSGVRYQPGGGNYFVTASYDQTAKIWSQKSWQPLRTLAGHDGKIMGLDVSPDGRHIATSSFDRTFKLWAPEH